MEWGRTAWMVASWCEVNLVSTMSEGWIRVNGCDADARRRDATTSAVPAALGKGLGVKFTIFEVVPGPVDAFDPARQRCTGVQFGTVRTA